MRNVAPALGRIVVPCLLVVLAGLSPARAELIDDFSVPGVQTVILIDLVDSDPTTVDHLNVGYFSVARSLTVDVADPHDPDPTLFMGRIGGGAFKFVSSSPGTTASLQYGALGDLYADYSAFDLELAYIEGGNAQSTDVEIEVRSGGDSASFSGAIDDSAGPTVFSVEFGEFTGADVFGDVTSVEFRFNPDDGDVAPNVNFELTSVAVNGEPIPEPSMLVMLASGLIGLVAYAWRRRRQKA